MTILAKYVGGPQHGREEALRQPRPIACAVLFTPRAVRLAHDTDAYVDYLTVTYKPIRRFYVENLERPWEPPDEYYEYEVRP